MAIVAVALGASAFLLRGVAHADVQCIPATVPPSDEAPQSVFTRAQTHFAAMHFDEAAILFRYLAMHHSDDDVGQRSALLYLKSASEVAFRQMNPACWDDIARDTPRLRDLYCDTTTKVTKNASTCAELVQMEADRERAAAQRLDKEAYATRDPKQALPLYAKAAAAYMNVFSKHCDAPVASGQKPHVFGCDQILHNAAQLYKSAGDHRGAIDAYRAAIRFDATTNGKSSLVPPAFRELALSYRATASYEDAADSFEHFVALDPANDAADSALSEATWLRLGVGQIDLATKDLELFLKTYGATSPVQAAQVIVAVATYHADHDAWKDTRATIEKLPNLFDRATPLDLRIRAHALLGRAGVRPKEEYAKVRDLWATDPNASEAKLRAFWLAPRNDGIASTNDGDEAAAAAQAFKQRFARVLAAVGEATIAAADDHRVAFVDSIHAPAFTGPHDHAALMHYVEHTLKPWAEKKAGAIATSELEYRKVDEIQPEAPAEVVVIANARSAMMWARLVEELFAVSSPPSWMTDPLERRDYMSSLDAIREPIRATRAKPAAVKCVESATRLRVADAENTNARACEIWLAKRYKAEHYLVDEIIPSMLRASGDRRLAPLK